MWPMQIHQHEEKDINDLAVLMFADTKMEDELGEFYHYEELFHDHPNKIQLMCSDNIPQNQYGKDVITTCKVRTTRT